MSETHSTAGTGYASFTGNASATHTFGACNRNQTFAAPNPPPTVMATTPIDGATDFPAAGDLDVSFSESVSITGNAFALQRTSSGVVPLSYASSGSNSAIATNTALHGGDLHADRNASAVTDSGGAHPTHYGRQFQRS